MFIIITRLESEKDESNADEQQSIPHLQPQTEIYDSVPDKSCPEGDRLSSGDNGFTKRKSISAYSFFQNVPKNNTKLIV